MKKTINYFIVIIFLITSCSPKSEIPISDSLKEALGNDYSTYVIALNKSVRGDSVRLLNFLKIKNIYDASGYDHGWVLIQLMKKVGDENFSTTLLKMNTTEINNLKEYFKVGLDGYSKTNHNLSKQFPLTFNILGFTENEIQQI